MSGWIGVDLDGTLAEYHGWGSGEIGDPVPLMLQRVIGWLNNHQDVRIFTARASASGTDYTDQIRAIEEWCEKHIGRKLPTTNRKDFGMIELWDDRCVQVIPNTGQRADGKCPPIGLEPNR